jgi:RecA-family ATPase
VAAGRNWLTKPDGSGGRTTSQAGMLWLNTDNAEQTHADRLNAVMRAMGLADIPLYSVNTTDFELKNPEHIDHVHDLADDLGAGVIVIDTLSGCLTGINENSAEGMTAPSAHLRALACNPAPSLAFITRPSTTLKARAVRVCCPARSTAITPSRGTAIC